VCAVYLHPSSNHHTSHQALLEYIEWLAALHRKQAFDVNDAKEQKGLPSEL
jgi:hypothetical protein